MMERTCWTCKHLLKDRGLACKAYPDGISIMIADGQHWHDHLFGDEVEKVFYDPITEEENKHAKP